MTFEEIKRKLEQKKMESARAEGRILQIKEKWKGDIGTDDIEEVKKYLAGLDADLEKARTDYATAMKEAEYELTALGG